MNIRKLDKRTLSKLFLLAVIITLISFITVNPALSQSSGQSGQSALEREYQRQQRSILKPNQVADEVIEEFRNKYLDYKIYRCVKHPSIKGVPPSYALAIKESEISILWIEDILVLNTPNVTPQKATLNVRNDGALIWQFQVNIYGRNVYTVDNELTLSQDKSKGTLFTKISNYPIGIVEKFACELLQEKLKDADFAIPPQFSDVHKFSEGLAAVRYKGKLQGYWGFIDKTGKLVIPVEVYSNGIDLRFSEGLAPFLQQIDGNIKKGYIDRYGRIVIKPHLNYLFSTNRFSEGYAVGCVGSDQNLKCAYIDRTGNRVISIPNQSLNNFSDGLARTRSCDKNKCIPIYIDKMGNIVISGIDGSDFSYGRAFSCIGWSCKIINKRGEVLGTHELDLPFGTLLRKDNFREGLVAVRFPKENGQWDQYNKDGKWGYLDNNGNVAIPGKYIQARNFHEGLAAVNVRENRSEFYTYIDKTGKIVFPHRFKYADDFSEGLARVWSQATQKWGYIDISGNYKIEPKYDYAGSFSEGMAHVRVGDFETGKYGFIRHPSR